MGENLASKLEIDVEIKSSADSFFKIMSSDAQIVPTATPDRIHAVELHEGEWEAHGSIKIWQYTLDGTNVETFKERIEVDYENKTVKMIGLEGHVMDHYKFYNLTFIPVPKDDGDGALVKVILETEKLHADVRDPQVYHDWLVCFVKDMDVHLQKA